MKNAVLTGAVHIGKSTVCLKVMHWAQHHHYRVRGIITTPLNDSVGSRLGFEIHSLESGERRVLAHVDRDWNGPRVGPFHFDPAALQWGEEIIAQAFGAGCDLLVLDEIGRLELEQATGFRGALQLLASAALPRRLVVVRDTLLDAFRSHVPTVQFTAFGTTKDNRDLVPGEIVRFLFGSA